MATDAFIPKGCFILSVVPAAQGVIAESQLVSAPTVAGLQRVAMRPARQHTLGRAHAGYNHLFNTHMSRRWHSGAARHQHTPGDPPLTREGTHVSSHRCFSRGFCVSHRRGFQQHRWSIFSNGRLRRLVGGVDSVGGGGQGPPGLAGLPAPQVQAGARARVGVTRPAVRTAQQMRNPNGAPS